MNVDKDERAATFVHRIELQDTETGGAMPFPLARPSALRPPWSSGPSTVGLAASTLDEVPGNALTLDVALEREMASRKPRTLDASVCGGQGLYDAALAPELVWGGEPIRRHGFTPLHETAGGLRVGWATLESRHVMPKPPRAGTRIQTFSAEVRIERKTSVRHSWVFDLDSGALVCTSSNVNLAFDVGARRSVEIPPELRKGLEAAYHPDLA